MTFVNIKSVEGESWWINPAQIYAIIKNTEGNIDIYLADDIIETSVYKSVSDAMDYIGISYNAEQLEEDLEESEEEQ